MRDKKKKKEKEKEKSGTKENEFTPNLQSSFACFSRKRLLVFFLKFFRFLFTSAVINLCVRELI